MKDTGIIRKVDELGRVVIPMEIREDLEIATKKLVSFEDKLICSKCVSKIKNLKEDELILQVVKENKK